MKNLLLMTILVGTIACNGSGGGTPMVEVDPETKQLVQPREVWSHELEACEEELPEETETLRYECFDKGIKPFTETWAAKNEIFGNFKIVNGTLESLGGSSLAHQTFNPETGEFSTFIGNGKVIGDWGTIDSQYSTTALYDLRISGTLYRNSDGSASIEITSILASHEVTNHVEIEVTLNTEIIYTLE